MNHELQEKLALFAANMQAIKKEFIWQNMLTKRLSTLIYTLENRQICCDSIRQSHSLIKNNTSMFSVFKGDMSIYVASILSLEDNREEIFTDIMSVYNIMKSMKFRASDYLAAAACQIVVHADRDRYHEVIGRTKAFYDGMKEYHRFYMGQDDYIFAAMLGMTDIDINTGTVQIENLYRRFKSEFFAGNSILALAQILVLDRDSDRAADCVLPLRDALRKNKIRLDKVYTLPSLGIFALLPVDIDTVIQDILYARDFLRTQRGFGRLSVSTQELLLYATAITASVYTQTINSDVITASAATSITNIIIAQQAAMMAAASSSAAAASVSN